MDPLLKTRIRGDKVCFAHRFRYSHKIRTRTPTLGGGIYKHHEVPNKRIRLAFCADCH